MRTIYLPFRNFFRMTNYIVTHYPSLNGLHCDRWMLTMFRSTAQGIRTGNSFSIDGERKIYKLPGFKGKRISFRIKNDSY